ncbi:MAG TPA: D-alanyl-D-alanine carboxypeptidase family protein [Actinomycetota bacterium]|nr:D-alanyl-D-alanine carboxypeptidase family protein [Actinomycetota bacterium]
MRRRAARGAVAVLPFLVLLAHASALGTLAPQGAPPPTPVPPNGSPSPFVSRLSVPADPITSPRVDTSSAILVDLAEGQVLYQRSPQRPQPVASLTKLMTALLVLEEEERLDRTISIHPGAVFGRNDYGGGSTLGLRSGERVSLRGLLAGLLLGSANDAAEALAIEVAGSVSAFVQDMNGRAKSLGMSRTRFASPHGLDDRGRSSSADLMLLLRAGLRHPTFRDMIARKLEVVRSDSARPRRIQNRNVMLWLYPGASGVKTGFTVASGFCLIATARRGDRQLAVVVLGGRDEVFSDAAALLNHGFAAYERTSLVEDGEPLGSVRVRGGEVPVVAGDGLDALVGIAGAGAIERILKTSPAAAYPPPSGSVVGTLRLTSSGTTLGKVPIVVADLGVPEEPTGSWWGRAAGAVSGAVGALVGALLG